MYSRPDVAELVNVQEMHGKAKAYQVRDFLALVEKYRLDLED